jgi:hypothetical protein
VKFVTVDTIIEEITDFIYLANIISEFKTDRTKKVHRYNKINGTIKRHFGKNRLPGNKLRI